MSKYMNERGFRIRDALDIIAAKLGSTPAAISLAWLITRPGIVAPIVSATNASQLNEIMTAVNLKLEESDIKLLDESSAYS